MTPDAGASLASDQELAPPGGGSAELIGGWSVGPRLRRTLIADVYRATRGEQHATLHIVHPELSRIREVVRAVQSRAPQAAAVTDHRNIGATYGAGFENGCLYVLTEPEDGPVLRDVLDRKHAA